MNGMLFWNTKIFDAPRSCNIFLNSICFISLGIGLLNLLANLILLDFLNIVVDSLAHGQVAG